MISKVDGRFDVRQGTTKDGRTVMIFIGTKKVIPEIKELSRICGLDVKIGQTPHGVGIACADTGRNSKELWYETGEFLNGNLIGHRIGRVERPMSFSSLR